MQIFNGRKNNEDINIDYTIFLMSVVTRYSRASPRRDVRIIFKRRK